MNREDLLKNALLSKYDLNKTNIYLESNGYSKLYVKNIDDTIWMFCIFNQFDIERVSNLCKKLKI